MPDIVATAGAATANSFVDPDYADTYLDARLNASAWTGESDQEQKNRALIEATRELTGLPWAGTRVTTTQILSWPREFAINPDAPTLSTLGDIALLYFASTVIPDRVKAATCELALEFLRAGTTDIAALDAGVNVTKEVIGPLETDYADPMYRAAGLARFPRILALVAPLFNASATGGLEITRT